MNDPTGKRIYISDLEQNLLGIHNEPGWTGGFTRQQYAGAWPNGTRVRKIRVDEGGDIHPVGALGRVLGSVGHPTIGAAYFVEWDASPRHALFVAEKKIERA